MRNLLLLTIVLIPAAAGCGSPHDLVAELTPEQKYELDEGRWVTEADLVPLPDPDFAGLEKATVAQIRNGTDWVFRFRREDDDVPIWVWISVKEFRVAGGIFWAREWRGETAWYLATEAAGEIELHQPEAGAQEGTMDVVFKGHRITPRGGKGDLLEFRVRGPFRVETLSTK